MHNYLAMDPSVAVFCCFVFGLGFALMYLGWLHYRLALPLMLLASSGALSLIPAFPGIIRLVLFVAGAAGVAVGLRYRVYHRHGEDGTR